MKVKHIFEGITGVFGAVIVYCFGGFGMHIQALFFAMVFDFLLGVVGAMVFHSSNKTNTGRLSSNALIKGVTKKCMVLFAVALCYRIDCMLQINICRNGAIIGFISGELVSILENLGLIGVPIPQQLKDIIEVLNSKKVKE